MFCANDNDDIVTLVLGKCSQIFIYMSHPRMLGIVKTVVHLAVQRLGQNEQKNFQFEKNIFFTLSTVARNGAWITFV